MHVFYITTRGNKQILYYIVVKLAVLFIFLNWPWCPRAWMERCLGALPTGLGALKIIVTSRPNGQCPKSNEFPTLIYVKLTLSNVLSFEDTYN